MSLRIFSTNVDSLPTGDLTFFTCRTFGDSINSPQRFPLSYAVESSIPSIARHPTQDIVYATDGTNLFTIHVDSGCGLTDGTPESRPLIADEGTSDWWIAALPDKLVTVMSHGVTGKSYIYPLNPDGSVTLASRVSLNFPTAPCATDPNCRWAAKQILVDGLHVYVSGSYYLHGGGALSSASGGSSNNRFYLQHLDLTSADPKWTNKEIAGPYEIAVHNNYVFYLDTGLKKLYIHPPPGLGEDISRDLDAVPNGYNPNKIAIPPLPSGDIIDIYIGCSPSPATNDLPLVQTWQLHVGTFQLSYKADVKLNQGTRSLDQMVPDRNGHHLIVSYDNPAAQHEQRVWTIDSTSDSNPLLVKTDTGWEDSSARTGLIFWLD